LTFEYVRTILFQLENDLKNYTAFKYGNYKTNALKADAVPSIFECQDEKGVRARTDPRVSSTKRSQKKLVQEVLGDIAPSNITPTPVDNEGNNVTFLLNFLFYVSLFLLS